MSIEKWLAALSCMIALEILVSNEISNYITNVAIMLTIDDTLYIMYYLYDVLQITVCISMYSTNCTVRKLL